MGGDDGSQLPLQWEKGKGPASSDRDGERSTKLAKAKVILFKEEEESTVQRRAPNIKNAYFPFLTGKAIMSNLQ